MAPLLPVVHVSPRLYASVERLAGLAGVSSSDIVEFVLGEIFEGELAPEAVKRPSKSPARVIPITRACPQRLQRRRNARPPA